ncbi:MAG: Fic family protein [Planctomycetota bacterium]
MPDKRANRYAVNGLAEAEFQPGSGKRILKNRLGIKSKRQIDQAEASAILQTAQWAVRHFAKNHRFTESDIRRIHRVFLGKIYGWAGHYRNVNIRKGGFPFAAAGQIPKLMSEFSRQVLARYTPCAFTDKTKIARAIGIVHAELLLIHPFREGNGRIARLLADLMSMQADLPPLDYGFIKGKAKERYYWAIQQSLKRKYNPITMIIKEALRRSLCSPDKVK